MKDRILSVAVALSLIAIVFVVTPSSTEAAVNYTGEIETTDDTGDPTDTYFRGDEVYVLVETFYRGNASNESFLVELRTQSGNLRDSFEADTGDPETGVYESWAATPWPDSLWTGSSFEGEIMVYDVILKVYDGFDPVEVDRTQIVVRNVGLFLDPDSYSYYPGQEVSLKLVTTITEDFYVQVINETGETEKNWTNLEVSEEDDWTWSQVWTIADDIPDGDYTINVRYEDNNVIWPASMYTHYITITKYVLRVECDAEYVLPGQTVSILYDVVDIATLTHHPGVTIEMAVVWTDVDDEEIQDDYLLPGSSGTYMYTVSEDIALYSDIEMTFWANESDDRSSEDSISLTVGWLAVDLSIDSGTYTPGDVVGVDVVVTLDVDEVNRDPLSGAEVDIVVSKNDVELPSYGASDLITGITGAVEHEFTLDNDAAKGAYVVETTMTILDFEVTRMAVFNVEWSGYMIVEFTKDYFYSDQTASMDFKVVWNNVEVDSTPVYYMVSGDSGLLITDNSTSGSASFQIPSDYVGGIEVSAVTSIEGYIFQDWDSAEVRLADLALYPQAESYRAGDTITWMYELAMSISNGSVSYVVVDDDGLKVASGSLQFAKSGSFDFAVPDADPAAFYTATLTIDDNKGNIVSESSTAWLFAEYELRIWLDSGADYTSRAFEPGATLVFRYSIDAIGVGQLDVYRISFYATDEYIDGNVLVTETTGTFEYELHDSVADGEYWMYAWLYDPSEAAGSLSFDSVSFDVKTDQSLWDKSVGGLSLFETIVLLLLLIMVILLVLVPMVRSRMEAKPKESASKPMELEPPPPAEELAGPEEPES